MVNNGLAGVRSSLYNHLGAGDKFYRVAFYIGELMKVLIMLLGVLLFTGYANAEIVGIDYHYGNDYSIPNNFTSEHADNEVDRISVRYETDKFWTNYRMQYELAYSDHKANEVPDLGQDTGFKEINALVAIKRHFQTLADIYAGVFLGLGYIPELPRFEGRDWKDGDLRSNIGQSHLLGSFGVLVGKDWKLYNNVSLRTEGRITHLSDPIRTDTGKNLMSGVLGLSYEF